MAVSLGAGPTSDDPEDYIDGLKIKSYPGESFVESDIPDGSTQTVKGVDNRLPTRLAWLVMGVGIGFTLASCFMFKALPSFNQEREPAPMPTVTVTVTAEKQVPGATKTKVPEPCVKALAAMQKYFDSAAKITSANNQQIDIMSDAYQAIMMHDWKRLNEIEARQRALEHSLADPTVQLMEPYKQVRSELDQCLTQLGKA